MRDSAKTSFARQLRISESLAERRLWAELRNRKLDDFKFVRQAPVGPYIADFLCREHNLVVEVDGATHGLDREIAYDESRTRHLNDLGFRVIRVHNVEILEAMDQVLTVISQALKQ